MPALLTNSPSPGWVEEVVEEVAGLLLSEEEEGEGELADLRSMEEVGVVVEEERSCWSAEARGELAAAVEELMSRTEAVVRGGCLWEVVEEDLPREPWAAGVEVRLQLGPGPVPVPRCFSGVAAEEHRPWQAEEGHCVDSVEEEVEERQTYDCLPWEELEGAGAAQHLALAEGERAQPFAAALGVRTCQHRVEGEGR